MSTNVLQAAKNPPLSERLDLLDALWESIIEEGYEPLLISAQADELDRRLKLSDEILMTSWTGRRLKPSLILHFIVEDDRIVVLAIFHARRAPSQLEERF